MESQQGLYLVSSYIPSMPHIFWKLGDLQAHIGIVSLDIAYFNQFLPYCMFDY